MSSHAPVPTLLLLFKVDGRCCAVPVDTVREIVRAVAVDAVAGMPHAVDGVCQVRGKSVPVVSMRTRLGLTSRPVSASDYFILVELGSGLVALRVDEVMRLDTAPIEFLEAGHATMAGLARLEEGTILVHDVYASLDASDTAAVAALMEAVG